MVNINELSEDEVYFFDNYKPLRNHLAKTSLEDSLYVLWNYSVFMQFVNHKMPPDIEMPGGFEGTKDSLLFKSHISPWELFTLAKEVVINAEMVGYENKSLKKTNFFADGINKLKALEESISKKYITSDNVLRELGRIAHRQFIWQSHYPHTDLLFRYFKIFNEPKMDLIVNEVIGIPSKKIYILGLATIGGYLHEINKKNLPELEIGEQVTKSDLIKFLEHFSIEIDELRNKLVSEQKYNEKYAYAYNSMFAYPIIKMKYHGSDSLVCPVPTLLYWRFTSGVYYELYNHPNFAHAFGDSFQNYVGNVLKKNIHKAEIFPEELYKVGKLKKMSSDWIISGDALVFIECKTKRISQSAKEELLTEKYINQEIGVLADAAIQIYKQINDFRNKNYKSISYSSNKAKKIYPLIVTLEDWFLFGDDLIKRLEVSVKDKLKEVGLDSNLWFEMPISVCCVEELERFTQLFDLVGIEKFMSIKVFDSDKKYWSFSNYPSSVFAEESKIIKKLYENEWDEIMPGLK